MNNDQFIIDATQEIFSSMIMLDAVPGEPFVRGSAMLENSISGLIGLAGKTKGMLAIHLPNTVALAVTSSFLGMEVDEIDEDVRDAIGELANMLGGSIKAFIDPKGSDIQISMPSAVHGEEYTIDCLAGAQVTCVPFTIDAGTFLVELQIRQDG